jgi:quercetin dioxygenase-like cupin family protein
MKIESWPFTGIDWSKVSATEYTGETGTAHWQTLEQGNVRVRMVRYSPGYFADHWCSRGHVIHVLEGTLVTELKDGREITTPAGSSYVVQENGAPHRSRTAGGALLFIVD